MTRVIGVRFRAAGKIYFFNPLQFEIKKGDHVIVETARGIEYGTVVSEIKEVEEEKVVQPLKPVIRIANQKDDEQEAGNKEKEKNAFKICLEKIRKHNLEMKLIDAEYTFDNNKVLFYFTADGRIDFRELVKDLASVFKTRIELRQIGVRDETKVVGGIGICGRPLCCHSYLSEFIPVSIKMAKEQNLSLNPTKISGVCGRLMCCLKNEEETYEELNRKLPNVGDFVTTDDGLKGEVQSVNVLRQLVKVVVDVNDEKEIREYDADRLRFKRKHGKKEKIDLSKEELQELERLEKEERHEAAEATEKQEHGQNSNRRGSYAENENRSRKDGNSGNSTYSRHEGNAEKGGRSRKENGIENENRNYYDGNMGSETHDYQENRYEGKNKNRNRQERVVGIGTENRENREINGKQENRFHRENSGKYEDRNRKENGGKFENRSRQNGKTKQNDNAKLDSKISQERTPKQEGK